MHIYIYTHIHLYIYIYVYVHTYTFMYVYTYIFFNTYICICICIYICVYICMYLYIHEYIYTYIWICLHIYLNIYIYRSFSSFTCERTYGHLPVQEADMFTTRHYWCLVAYEICLFRFMRTWFIHVSSYMSYDSCISHHTGKSMLAKVGLAHGSRG